MVRAFVFAPVLVGCGLVGCGSGRPSCPTDVPTASSYRETVRTEHFEVEGSTPLEIRRSTAERVPESDRPRELAYTASEFCIAAAYKMVDGRCKLFAYRVELHITFVMPKWKQPSGVAEKTITWWKEDYALIAKHEQGHAAISVEGAKAMYTAGNAISDAPTCEGLESALQKSYDTVFEETRKRHLAYDAEQGTLDHLPELGGAQTPGG